MSPSEPYRAGGRLSALAQANLLVLGGFTVLFCWQLLPQWLHNPDLAHGVFMPVIFLLLLRESRRAGPFRYWRPGLAATAAVAGLAAAGLAVLSVAGLYAAAVDWSNALVEFLLAAALALLLAAALVDVAGAGVRLIPSNWSAWVAVGLWPLAAPIPSGMYARLTLALQLWISTGVMDALQLLGVAAHRQGNIIELATCRVGIEEACSGVRSLVSCVFVALFFSATLVRRPAARLVVIGVAAPLALAMNFLRALALTLLANGGVSIAGFWHDATGYAVLLVTALLLAGLALGLEDGPSPNPASLAPAASDSTPGLVAGHGVLATALALAAGLVVFFGLNTHPAVRRGAPVPDLAALMPAPPPGWSAASATDLGRFQRQLQTDVLFQRMYQRGSGTGAALITLYVAYWRPGQAPVSLVDQHTPDACWPGAGWIAQPAWQPGPGLAISGRSLAPASPRLFTNDGVPRYVWFWHLYRGERLSYDNPYSAAELLRLAWRYGFRHNGDQMFVSVSSNRPWDQIAAEPLLRTFFANLRPLGL
jgi:exosortase